VLRVPDGEHRTRCRAYDALGHATHQHVRDRASPVRAEHDKVGVRFGGVADDLPDGIAGPGHKARSRGLGLARGQHLAQPLVRLPLPPPLDIRHREAVRHRRPRERHRVGHDVQDVQRGVKRLGERATVPDRYL
jgi:hypothetical protein